MYKTSKSIRLMGGDPNEPVNVGLLKSIFALILFIPAVMVQFLIVALLIMLNALTLGMTHITFKVEAKALRMPNGEIRQPAT